MTNAGEQHIPSVNNDITAENAVKERCRAFLSSPYFLALNILVTVSVILGAIKGCSLWYSIPVILISSAFSIGMWLAYIDAKTAPVYMTRGLKTVDVVSTVQAAAAFAACAAVFTVLTLGMLEIDILPSFMDAHYQRIASLGLWNVLFLLLTAAFAYMVYLYVMPKRMLIKNFIDAAEIGVAYPSGALNYARGCIVLAVLRLSFFNLKRTFPDWTELSFVPEAPGSFLNAYAVGGNHGVLGTISACVTTITLLYMAYMALKYLLSVKKIKKDKKTLDKSTPV